MSNGALTLDAIAASGDLATETVPVPEWGGAVVLSSFTGADRNTFEARLSAEGDDQRNYRALEVLMVALALRTGDGRRLSANAGVEAIEAVLLEKSAAIISRLATVVMRLNRMGAREPDTEKNVDGGTGAASSTDSPEI